MGFSITVSNNRKLYLHGQASLNIHASGTAFSGQEREFTRALGSTEKV